MSFMKSVLVVSSVIAIVAILVTVIVPPAQLDRIFTNYLPKDIAQKLAGVLKLDSNKDDVGTVFSKQELEKYVGEDGSPGLYLAILGEVFDVSKGAKHYGPKGGYHFFTGKDGTKAFITGEFNDEGIVEDVSGLSNSQLVELEEWSNFYKRDYIYKGVLDGHYYDASGKPKPSLLKVHENIKLGKVYREKEKEDEKKFPSCNSEWTQASGGRVWCSDRSGGIKRDWEGVPRIYHKPGSKSTRCACIKTTGPPIDQPGSKSDRGDLDNPNFKQYLDCDELAISCRLP